jgi:hypothetical protein
MGYASLKDNTTRSNNTGIGFCQMSFNAIAVSNTALGAWLMMAFQIPIRLPSGTMLPRVKIM